MTFNQVYDDTHCKVLYKTHNGLNDAVEWMMERADTFQNPQEIYAEEITEIDDSIGGWWNLIEVLEENGNRYNLKDGRTVVLENGKIYIKKGKIAMNKTTKLFGHDYDNDTTIEYVQTGSYSMLNCSYTNEDPDYGTETMHFVSKDNDPMEKVAYQMLGEVKDYLDYRNGKIEEPKADVHMDYKRYCDSTLIAVESALHEITKDYKPDNVNEHGHEFMIDKIKNCAAELVKRFVNEELRCAYVAIRWDESRPDCADYADGWHKIVRQELPFDNNSREMFLLMGYCGGGNVTSAYTYDCKNLGDDPYFIDNVAEMIVESTGESNEDSRIYMEFIGINDEHSYEIDMEEK